ncbi:hypothetical protein C8F01DRAFT_1244416 [Mycena amicta]|nr:hypothetical protein C8F01DRAFT_1244416 [Mycena amicta]
MAHLIITGATGTVGNGVLRIALASPQISRVSILSRRQFTLPDGPEFDRQKAQIIIHTDYSKYPESLLELLKGADGCVWAQGISQTQAFSSLSDKGRFNFVYVSGEGADQSEKAWSLFGKIKGRAERDLRALSSIEPYASQGLRVFNVRPGFVDAAPGHQSPDLSPLVLTHHLLVGLSRMLFLHRYISPTDTMGKVFIDLATGSGDPIPAGVGIEDGGRLVTSPGIRRLGGL